MNFLKNSAWRTIKKIANLNFSIYVLLCIALFSVIGSVIEQEQSLEYYQLNYPISRKSIFVLNWKIITFLGLDHIYNTWWFSLILIIFSLSIILCTFSIQLPSLKNARRWKFLKSQSNITEKIHSNKHKQSYNSLSNMIYVLSRKNYYVFHKKYSLYAYKGLLGRIGPVFVHLSIIIAISGFILSIIGSFTVQEMIPNGESVHLKNVIKSGLYSRLPNDVICKVDTFRITYNRDNSIQQFFSDISLLDNTGDQLVSKKIKVNSPLIFRGITFYQTDWNISALRININMDINVQQPLQKIKIGNNNIWLATLFVDSKQCIIFLIFNLKDPILIYDQFGHYLREVSVTDSFIINNNIFRIQDIVSSTGLQIKADPGIYIVYFGFLVIMMSTLLSYVSYCQIWVNMTNDFLYINGSVNRGLLKFEEDLSIIQIKYRMYTFTVDI